ncbi:tryptophan dimethylallyltransferase family protein [Streptomyces daghestanicus]|uniref:Prenyltransferase n=1 Tax=Streptomyces daghestanicus TaxID=66885 RepID=A0ABQ3QDI0_9ACTN|nr:tryptophan dimethylallyltransferase family protein [Streptomyces daghestanicus]GGU16557.1 prenyltransferase [Streptomyces daghestanicus]GHI35353.1 prenyltransferase [Streptomyces daghestanicus]
MTGSGPAGRPALGAFTGAQLRGLCAVAGLSGTDARIYAGVLAEALGPLSRRPLDLPPADPTFLSDDHTPVEFSLSFRAGADPALRVLVEPGWGAGGPARNGRRGLAAVRAMARRWGFSTGPLDTVADLFLPPDAHGPLALWVALELRPGGVPGVKVYLNPGASGPERSAETVLRALCRLGHRSAAAALPEADGHPFFALDLGDWERPRVKVYCRHDGLTAERAGQLSRAAYGPRPEVVAEFFRTAAGPCPAPGGQPVLTGRPGLTCLAFTGPDGPVPGGFTLHVPVRDYAGDDREALARAERVLRRHGMDPAPLARAWPALTGRRPEDGVGLVAYLALAHQAGAPPRVTAYLSSEAYAVRPPARTGRAARAAAVP